MASMRNSWWRPDPTAWAAHGWTIEIRDDELAEIAHQGHPIVRAVRAAVRDRGWQTVPASVQAVTATESSLEISLLHEGLGARITSRLRVQAEPDQLTIDWEGLNLIAFDTCRVGLVVLHPSNRAGRAVTVTHTDGTHESSHFPTDISPHQPFSDIRALRDGDATLVFEGDMFEMEDQRNWSDASFKTYSRPLDLPYPYRLEAGESVRQSLTIRLEGSATDAATAPEPGITLRAGGAFPSIGVEVCTAPSPVDPSPLGAFRVIELDLTTRAWAAALERAAADGLPLDVRLVTDGDTAVLESAVRALDALHVVRILAVDSRLHISDAATLSMLRAAQPTAPIMGGTRSHFTELNREQRRIPRDVEGLLFTTTPLFHTLDTEQLVESVAMQRLVAEQSVRIADGRPVHIGPVSLRPRFNNVATTPESAPAKSDLSEGFGAAFTGGVDERQSAPELAAWVIASAAALAVPGVASLSWFETAGPRGLAGTPAAEAVMALLAFDDGELLTGPSPDGLVWAIGSRRAGVDALLVANLDRRQRSVDVRLDTGTVATATLAAGAWARTELR
ncbi:hypothetical protein [Microbacterium hydrocarbonoxydans]|nr:hypothetical protein [Microbacterium hydrocarbonoxydans]